jgi:hypothetical protein
MIRASPLILINLVFGKEWMLRSAASCNFFRYYIYIILLTFRYMKRFLICQIVISFRINSICTYIYCDISCTIRFTIDLITTNTQTKISCSKMRRFKNFRNRDRYGLQF